MKPESSKSKFNISEATDAEINSIVKEPQMLENLKLDKDFDISNFKRKVYIIKFKSYKLLFMYWKIIDGIYEIHISCPKDSVIASRLLCLAGINELFKRSEIRGFITSCPAGKIANMCRKIGFKKVNEIDGKLYFILLNERGE